MGASKLGIHVNDFRPADEIIAFVERAKPRVIKVLDFNMELIQRCREKSPQSLIIGRVYLPESEQIYRDDPEDRARRFWEAHLEPRVRQFGHLIDAWEGYNEVAGGGYEELALYARFEAERTRFLADAGARSVVGNFATGNPTNLEWWPAFFPALETAKAHDGFLGLHEYSAPYMQWMYGRNQWNPAEDAGDTGWTTCRYRKVYRQMLPPELHLPLLVTECGIDGGVNPRPGPPGGGWKDFVEYWRETGRDPDGPTEYMNQLRWYDEELQKDPYVVGATIYCFGVIDPRWESFNIVGPMAQRLADYLVVNPPLPWPEEVVTDPEQILLEQLRAEFGDQFDDIRDALPATGHFPTRPLEQIHYLAIHHTGAGTTSRTWSSTVARDHVENRGWPAIGYHFLVYNHKVRYCGSILTSHKDAWGLSAETVDVAFVGDYDEEAPSDRAIELAARLLDLLEGYLGRPVPRKAHRDLALPGHETTSPGQSGFGPDGWLRRLGVAEAPGEELAELRRQVAELQARVAELEQQLETQVAELQSQLDARDAALQQIIQTAREALG
jgi:uncharacterized small protein (DUF1192 family)